MNIVPEPAPSASPSSASAEQPPAADHFGDPFADRLADQSADPALREALQRTLHSAPAGVDEQAHLKALHSRWMQDWARHTGQLPTVPDGVAPASAAPSTRPRAASLSQRPARGHVATGGWFGRGGAGRAPAWLGGMGVAAAVVAGVLLWQQHQNEVLLDELSQVDVLSQMAAGEM